VEIAYRLFSLQVTVTCDRCGMFDRFSMGQNAGVSPRIYAGDGSQTCPNWWWELPHVCGGKERFSAGDAEATSAQPWVRAGASMDDAQIRLRGCHVTLDCVFKQFRVRFDVQCLHHPVLMKGNRARFNVDNIGHFFHRHSFRQ
jgi:hypothetical protein